MHLLYKYMHIFTLHFKQYIHVITALLLISVITSNDTVVLLSPVNP